MKEILLTLVGIIMPLLWIAIPILMWSAVYKLQHLYNEDNNKAGFKLKKRIWGPTYMTYKKAKKVAALTKDEDTRKKAYEAIRLWKMSYYCFFCFIIAFFLIGFLQR